MKKGLLVIFKLSLILAFIIYLVFALTKWNKEDNSRMCNTVDIAVNDSAQAGFITRSEVEGILKQKNLYPAGKRMDYVDTRKIETTLLKNPFIDRVSCFKTAGDAVCINVYQRLPLMRIMSDDGQNYFIDRSGKILPRMHYAADIVVATGHISRSYAQKKLYPLGKIIGGDRFWDNQIEQVYVDSIGGIEIIPRVGNHVAYLGAPVSLELKLRHLKTFYRQVLSQVGWNKYSRINLEYNNQIICTKR